MYDVAIEHVQHHREVTRTACDLQVRVVVICRVDAKITSGSGHDLREPESPNGGACPDLEPAFLPDQRLQQAAPLDQRQPRAAYARQTVRVARGADDQLLDPFPGIAEHACSGRVIVLGPIEAGGRAFDLVNRTLPRLQPGHGACDIAGAEGHGIHEPFEGGELLALDLGQLLFTGQPVLLQRQIAISLLKNRLPLCEKAQVESRHALGDRWPHRGTCQCKADHREGKPGPHRLSRPPPAPRNRKPCRAA